jgi:hypothetical protein
MTVACHLDIQGIQHVSVGVVPQGSGQHFRCDLRGTAILGKRQCTEGDRLNEILVRDPSTVTVSVTTTAATAATTAATTTATE